MEPLVIEKPDLSSVNKAEVLNRATQEGGSDFTEYVKKINEPQYLYWDNAKYKPTPKNLNSLEFWY
mgnify:FL=1